MNRFFRKELNLEKKWWHRALLSLYFMAFVLTIGVISYATFVEEKQYVKVEPVSNYFTQDPIRLSEIISNIGQKYKIGLSNYFSEYGSSDFDTYKDITFCGTDIASNLDGYAFGGKKIERFMVWGEDGLRKYVAKEELINFLNSGNISCITIDSFNVYENREYFIEPSRYAEELWFYEYSFLKTLVKCLQYITYTIIIFITIAIFYYKVLIYIIFGKSSRDIS